MNGESGVTRKLAAILAADVVGYSRLMEADETGTHARLKAVRKEFIEPRITEHHGRIVKLTGDGALVEFGSVVEAVLCAVDVQRAREGRPLESDSEPQAQVQGAQASAKNGRIPGLFMADQQTERLSAQAVLAERQEL